MLERDSGNQKFSRRDLFSIFKPKKSKTEEESTDEVKVDPWRLTLTRRELLTSAGYGSALGVVNMLVTSGAERLNIPLGQPTEKGSDEAKYNIIGWSAAVLGGGIAAPYVEESLFRAWPSQHLAATSGYRWDVGVPSSVVFALFHNVEGKWGLLPTGVSAERIPLPQLAGSLLFWKMVREGGRGKSIVAHSTHNITVLAAYAAKLTK